MAHNYVTASGTVTTSAVGAQTQRESMHQQLTELYGRLFNVRIELGSVLRETRGTQPEEVVTCDAPREVSLRGKLGNLFSVVGELEMMVSETCREIGCGEKEQLAKSR